MFETCERNDCVPVVLLVVRKSNDLLALAKCDIWLHLVLINLDFHSVQLSYRFYLKIVGQDLAFSAIFNVRSHATVPFHVDKVHELALLRED